MPVFLFRNIYFNNFFLSLFMSTFVDTRERNDDKC